MLNYVDLRTSCKNNVNVARNHHALEFNNIPAKVFSNMNSVPKYKYMEVVSDFVFTAD